MNRFPSLDIFRGATVALMILVNNPGNWGQLFEPLAHAPWHGCTPTDLVFPFFLFAVGNAMSFVMPKLEQAGTAAVMKKVWKRVIIIFAIGLFLNWSPFIKWDGENLVFKYWVDPKNPESGIRIMGVLQRIALAYGFAAMAAYFLKIRGSAYLTVVILLGYWLVCILGNSADPYSLNGWFGTAIDNNILGVAHLYKGEGLPFDPEGLMSGFTPIAQVLFGYFVGHYIQSSGRSYEMLAKLLMAGVLLVASGYAWDFGFPINKKIWTSSYVLYTSGLATVILSVLLYLMEFKKASGWWVKFFDVFGKNPLFIFVLSGFLPRVIALFRWETGTDEAGKKLYTSALPWFYEHVCKPVSSNLKIGSFLYALVFLAFMWSLVYWMDKKKWYVKV